MTSLALVTYKRILKNPKYDDYWETCYFCKINHYKETPNFYNDEVFAKIYFKIWREDRPQWDPLRLCTKRFHCLIMQCLLVMSRNEELYPKTLTATLIPEKDLAFIFVKLRNSIILRREQEKKKIKEWN